MKYVWGVYEYYELIEVCSTEEKAMEIKAELEKGSPYEDHNLGYYICRLTVK